MGFEFLPSVGALGWGILYAIVAFLFVLTIVVFIHELGHFLVARWYGVRVLVFSIGFGPELFGFNDRYGTRWKVSAIPLGGYVKFFGDENAASVPDQAAAAAMSEAERKVSFVHQKVGPRAAIVVAGPVANFILAIVIFAVAAMIYGTAEHAAARRYRCSEQRGRRGRLPARRCRAIHQWARHPQLLRYAAHRQLQRRRAVDDRRRARRYAGDAQGDAGAAGCEGQFRQHPPHGGAGDNPVAGGRRRPVRTSRVPHRRRSRFHRDLGAGRADHDLYLANLRRTRTCRPA